MKIPRREFKKVFPELKIKSEEKEECNSTIAYCKCGCILQYKRYHVIPHSSTHLEKGQEWCKCGIARHKKGMWGYFRVCNEHLS